ncbi:hybrid sensor histidine kinase/response regulator [Eleftheria terrae]|uniref:hybrid sensor histidine kinase/response regulator n=1 Tax=Eleftheria terrae TaxID=1597781 RepID=UPI00263A5A18|nr:ATP-binding protein [Eleftheria terrae]WKB53626.1 ATP-binding protein [Eleftheria terrae]
MQYADDGLPAAEVLFEQAACGLLLSAADGRILRANATCCRWLGYHASELSGGMRVQDLLTMGGRVFHQTHWAPLLQMQGSVAEVKLDLLHRDGHTVPMLLNAVRREHAGTVCHELALMVVNDRHRYERELLQARKNAESALAAHREAEKALQESRDVLAQADRRKDEFLATLAHELRNPLAPMRNVLEILRRKQLADAQLLWCRDVLERQLRHMTHLVDDLLEVSRITQGKLALRRQPVELATAVQGAVEAARPMIEAASHQLQLEMPDETLVLDADPTRLTQVILNLLTNAAKYTPAGGHISLRVWREGGEVVLSVRDSGIGIPRQHLASVFEMFSQLAPALERSQGGLGIGLALVRGLVQLHGGTIHAESEGPGRGSEFLVRLPLSPQASPPPQSAQAARFAAEARRRVLVVDDNEDAARSLAMVLELQGHHVCTANDGADAIRMVRSFSPELVLLDIGLPQLNGYEVARHLRRQDWGRSLCLVALTGWGQQQDKRLAAEAGFDQHLTKPVEPDALAAILAQLPSQGGPAGAPDTPLG